MMFSSELLEKAEVLLEAYRKKGWMLATAESCTGGLISGCLTEIAGSSDVVERGFVTYTNTAKMEMLGVASATLERVGAVSGEVAEEMAAGALAHSPVQATVSATGIAGPGGGSADKPVGLVYFGMATQQGLRSHERHVLSGDRSEVRRQSVSIALDLLLDATR
jgi:nicotinamide-nucleotide amidase